MDISTSVEPTQVTDFAQWFKDQWRTDPDGLELQ